jgi:esterase/lipase superfamily enzyme
LLQLLKGRTGITQVHILAHSMGNLAVLDALANYQEDRTPLNLGELMMAVPDVDRDLYRGIAAKTRKITVGMTLYASSEDKALALSKRLAGEIPRAGEVSADGPIVLPGIDSIDASSLGDEMLGLNHGTYASSRSIINDLGIIITQGIRPPDQRLRELRCVPEGSQPPKYWRYTL